MFLRFINSLEKTLEKDAAIEVLKRFLITLCFHMFFIMTNFYVIKGQLFLFTLKYVLSVPKGLKP